MNLSESIARIEHLVEQLHWVLTVSDKEHEFNLINQIGASWSLVDDRPTSKDIMKELYLLLDKARATAKSQEIELSLLQKEHGWRTHIEP